MWVVCSVLFRDFGAVADTVFVCHLTSPWNLHVVTSLDSEIKHLVWDSSGTRLLIADASGQILLCQMHESLINYWTLTSVTKTLFGEDLIAVKWIHSSQPVSIMEVLSC